MMALHLQENSEKEFFVRNRSRADEVKAYAGMNSLSSLGSLLVLWCSQSGIAEVDYMYAVYYTTATLLAIRLFVLFTAGSDLDFEESVLLCSLLDFIDSFVYCAMAIWSVIDLALIKTHDVELLFAYVAILTVTKVGMHLLNMSRAIKLLRSKCESNTNRIRLVTPPTKVILASNKPVPISRWQ